MSWAQVLFLLEQLMTKFNQIQSDLNLIKDKLGIS